MRVSLVHGQRTLKAILFFIYHGSAALTNCKECGQGVRVAPKLLRDSGVRQTYLLAEVSRVTGKYEVVRSLLRRLSLNILRKVLTDAEFVITTDMKMQWILTGLLPLALFFFFFFSDGQL